MMHVGVLISGESSVWGGVVGGVFFSLERGTVRAVRALNRQRIMEIKAERLANGNIMATDCLGQLGHANEAAEEESICMDKVLLKDGPISVMLHTYMCRCRQTHTHTHRE